MGQEEEEIDDGDGSSLEAGGMNAYIDDDDVDNSPIRANLLLLLHTDDDDALGLMIDL